ncbi:MAG TPA: DUF222 domain-containing protein [Candidatus Dormibacteraeota bacterium]|nr:DUF222 domain-containing protein [Candidatus Dormibacteraeota bacterium]
MIGELEKLRAAVREFVENVDDRDVDLAELRSVLDNLEGKFCSAANKARERGDHLVGGNISACSWIARTCGMSSNSVSDRLCVGKQLESLPRVAAALSSGQIGYQAAAVICHLQDKLAGIHGSLDEERWIEWAGYFSIKRLNELALYERHVADPDGFARDEEEDFEQRRLHISRSGNLYFLDGILNVEGGAALRTTLEALARRHAPDDERTPGQRRADALVELTNHAMDAGGLPRRNGVRPHVTVTTSLEGLENRLGVPASDLEQGLPVSSRMAERLACDGTLCRVMTAESVVTDVGRATRAVSPSTRRALSVRDKGCRWPGCDRPVSWSSAHHIEFWTRGGHTKLSNLLTLCWYHHRCVHEGGWQVVKAGDGFKFIPPERLVSRRARGPGMRWAA